MKKNDIIKLKITSMTAQGSGVGKSEDGIVVFVPFCAVDDVIEAKILKVKKTYAYGKIERIINPSFFRINPDCEAFTKCGGCAYRHLSYNSEKEIKRQRIVDAVERIGGLSGIKIKEVVENKRLNRYRNKAQLPCQNTDNGVEFGFYAAHSHRIVPFYDCLLQPKLFKKVINITEAFMRETEQSTYDEKSGQGKLRHLYIRYAEMTNQLMICFVINGNGLKSEDVLIKTLKEQISELKTIVFNSNKENTNVVLGSKNRTAYGNGYIEDILCGKRFRISPLSFYQVNRAQAEKLYTIARDYAELKKDDVLLDLYCGTGTIGLTMAENCKKLIGVEIIEDAVKDAYINAELNGIKNAEFIWGDAQNAAQKLKEKNINPDVIVVDPPRKGLTPELINTIIEMNPERVVYVSCDCETLARDLKQFNENYYSLKEITPVDLFSRTPHIECVCKIEKTKHS